MNLTVAFCDHTAAEYAVMHWHYSERMPVGKLVKVGAWEDDRFVGAVLFGRGNSPHLGRFLDLDQSEIVELVRIALRDHQTPVSQIAMGAVKLLREQSPGLRAIVSYSDPSQGHAGKIYQAMNWVYVGKGKGSDTYYFDGKWSHNRSVRPGKNGGSRAFQMIHAGVIELDDLPRRDPVGKHKYVLPLDKAIRRRLLPLQQPYPQAAQVSEGDAALPA